MTLRAYRCCLQRWISIHTFLAEGDTCESWTRWAHTISIHTFLAEGDLGYRICFDSLFYFNPHLPCGRWPDSLLFSRQFCNFNPHLPYGRWRHSSIVTWQAYTFQSTPSLQKVTTTAVNDVYDFFISIHTFLAEGDNKLAVARYTLAVFQSTPSSRKVTPLFFLYHRWLEISIHTFLAEGDTSW